MKTISTRAGLTRRDLFRHSARLVGAAIALDRWPQAVTTLLASPLGGAQQATDSVAAMFPL
jgi:hypothetical protein